MCNLLTYKHTCTYLWTLIIITVYALQEHRAVCKYAAVPCPNSEYGCSSIVPRVDIEDHLNTHCQFKPVQCSWCGKQVINEKVRLLDELNLILFSGWLVFYITTWLSKLYPFFHRITWRLSVKRCWNNVPTSVGRECQEKMWVNSASQVIWKWSFYVYICIYFLQLTRHTRTVCTHQVRNCDFKDLGCQYKVCPSNACRSTSIL